MDGERILGWSERWLRSDDVERIVRPAIADWRHEVATSAPAARAAARRRGWWSTLGVIVRVLIAERVALARVASWWLLALPAIAVAIGALATGTLGGLAFLGVGVVVFALVATTPARWVSAAWAWAGVGALALTLLVGEGHAGATRWVTLGPLHVQVTMLVLPLALLGGRWPAAVAAWLLAAAPDALGGLALAVAAPHPLTMLGAIVACLREPALTIDAPLPVAALAASAIVVLGAWRHRALPQGRLVLALVVLGLGAHLAGHAPMPLVGPGGSAIVATCLALALVRAGPSSDRSFTRMVHVG